MEKFQMSKPLMPQLSPGALIEVSGPDGGGKTEVTFELLRELMAGARPIARPIGWIEEGLSAFPSAFPQYGLSLDQVLFIDAPPGQSLWAAQQLIRSGLLDAVVLRSSVSTANASTLPWEELTLRRLQLAAEKSKTSVFLISPTPQKQGAWPLTLQLQVRRSRTPHQRFIIDVIKARGETPWRQTWLTPSSSPVVQLQPEALCRLA